jgi:hypothetical protein
LKLAGLETSFFLRIEREEQNTIIFILDTHKYLPNQYLAESAQSAQQQQQQQQQGLSSINNKVSAYVHQNISISSSSFFDF